MSQNYYDDCYDDDVALNTELLRIENNFNAIKTNFCGSSEPTDGSNYNVEPFMNWGDESKNVLKMRSHDDSEWWGHMHGDEDSEIFVYRNDTLDGWIVDNTSGLGDCVIAIKGGSVYTTGGVVASDWSFNPTMHNHKWYDMISFGSIISHWPIDEDDGLTPRDIVGSYDGFIGLGSGVSYKTGVVSECLHFDGSSGYVNIGDHSVFDFTTNDDFALSFWMYMDDTPTAIEVLIAKFSSGDGVGWEIRVQSDSRLHFITADSSNSYDTYSQVLSSGNWYHVVVNYSGGTATIYIDNTDETASHATHYIDSAAGYSLMFGCSSDPNYFDGKLDEIRIYDHTLSSSERSLLYNEPDVSSIDRLWNEFEDKVNIVSGGIAYVKYNYVSYRGQSGYHTLDDAYTSNSGSGNWRPRAAVGTIQYLDLNS